MDIDTYCEKLAPFISIIKNGVIPIINIGIPFILIVLGSIDLGKAVVSGDDKSTKEAQSNLIKRIIYGVVIFFVPLILSLVFKLVGDSIKIENDEIITPTSWLKCWSNEDYTSDSNNNSNDSGDYNDSGNTEDENNSNQDDSENQDDSGDTVDEELGE